MLKWKTENEINTAHFVIERSADGSLFKSIGSVNANNVNGQHVYGFTDMAPLPKINLYRLKMLDIDGKYTYSSTLKIDYTSLPVLTIFPNPAQEMITISGAESNTVVKIMNVQGAVLKTQLYTPGMKINITGLKPGIYYVNCIAKEKMVVTTFIKD